MKIKNHLLYHADGQRVEWHETPNKSGHLEGNAPQFIVLHYTAGSSVESAMNTFRNRQANASAHLIIGQDGRVVQMGRFHERCWHAGVSQWQGLQSLNRYSVGIELVNWGWLTGGFGRWRSWAGTPVADEKVTELAHQHDGVVRGWESYSETQLEKTAEVVRALLHRYDLTPADIVGHDDISPGRKQDPGPAFPLMRFRGLLEGRRDMDATSYQVVRIEPQFSVTAASGLNLRSGPSINDTILKTLARNTLVIRLETLGQWWLVSEVSKGTAGATGWVYSHWLAPVSTN